MKRDMDLIREILLKVEACRHPPCNLGGLGRRGDDVGYHVMIMAEAGLLEAFDSATMGSLYDWHARRLTWAGHEFLDQARNDTTWNKAKEIMQKKAIDASLDSFVRVLKHVAPVALAAALSS